MTDKIRIATTSLAVGPAMISSLLVPPASMNSIGPEATPTDMLSGMVLGHVLFSSLIQMAAGRRTPEDVMQDLAMTAELALGRR